MLHPIRLCVAESLRGPDTHKRRGGVPSGVVKAQTVSLTIVAFLIGVLAAGGIGVRVIREVRTDDVTRSLPGSSITAPTYPSNGYFVDPDETLIASTAVIPLSVRQDGSSLSIRYDLVSRSPIAGMPDTGPFLLPSKWVLRIGSTMIEGGPADPDTRVALFDLPQGARAAEIDVVEIINPLAAYPLNVFFGLSETNPRVEIIDGVSIELLRVSEEGANTIVHIRIDVGDPAIPMIWIEGAGPGWRPAVREAARLRVDLTWVGGDLPETIRLRAHGTQWIEIEGRYRVSIGKFG